MAIKNKNSKIGNCSEFIQNHRKIKSQVSFSRVTEIRVSRIKGRSANTTPTHEMGSYSPLQKSRP